MNNPSNPCGSVYTKKHLEAILEGMFSIAGVPGEKPEVTSDKLPDSRSKFPCIHL